MPKAALRSRIDGIDGRIVRLLGKREALVRRIMDLKACPEEAEDPARAPHILARTRALARDAGARPDGVEAVYRVLLRESADFQRAELRRRAGESPAPGTRVVRVGSVAVGGSGFAVIAGPCVIESEAQIVSTAVRVAASGACALRGGVYKPRTAPGSFQGLGERAIGLAALAKRRSGLPFVAEVIDPRQIEKLMPVVDAFQVGARNMYNSALLRELGRTRKPVLLKRGMCALVDEWLQSAEYVLREGNDRVILCERGIRTFETATRNTLDLNAVALLKSRTTLPVIVDPSHGTGRAELVGPMALAAAAAGADGVIVEVHPRPAEARSDASQTLDFGQFDALMARLRRLLPPLGRTLTKSRRSS